MCVCVFLHTDAHTHTCTFTHTHNRIYRKGGRVIACVARLRISAPFPKTVIFSLPGLEFMNAENIHKYIIITVKH